MKRFRINIFFLCIFLLLSSCYNEEVYFNSSPNKALELPLVLNFNSQNCSFDSKNNLFRYSISENELDNFKPFVEFNNNANIEFEGIKLNNKAINQLGKIEISKLYKIRISIDSKLYDFNLVFSNLSIIQIITDSEIYDDPKVLGRIQYNEGGLLVSDHYAGIEYRGTFSRDLPKKSYGFTLWERGLKNMEYSTAFEGMGTNSDWILNGSIIDPARIRNVVSFKLWSKMGEINSHSAHYSIDFKPVELFMNNDYRGLYFFSENLNHIMLKCSKNAVLYKSYDWGNGATRFENFEPVISSNQFWNGWEQKYPNRKEEINWQPLKELYDLVINSSDIEFAQEIDSSIDISLCIDYFLLLNLCYSIDNTGKNIFLFKDAESDKFMIIPWDLDGSWGIKYDGQRVSENNILTNNLYQRLYNTNPNNYRDRLKERWYALRSDVFSEVHILNEFENYFELFRSSDIIEMENRQWNGSLNMENEMDYINSWTSARIQFLDTYFSTY